MRHLILKWTNFQLQNVGSSKCLSTDDGTHSYQWDCLDESMAKHQSWQIVRSTSATNDYGVFALENAKYSGKCLNAVSGLWTASSLNIDKCATTSSSQLFSASNLVVR